MRALTPRDDAILSPPTKAVDPMELDLLKERGLLYFHGGPDGRAHFDPTWLGALAVRVYEVYVGIREVTHV